MESTNMNNTKIESTSVTETVNLETTNVETTNVETTVVETTNVETTDESTKVETNNDAKVDQNNEFVNNMMEKLLGNKSVENLSQEQLIGMLGEMSNLLVKDHNLSADQMTEMVKQCTELMEREYSSYDLCKDKSKGNGDCESYYSSDSDNEEDCEDNCCKNNEQDCEDDCCHDNGSSYDSEDDDEGTFTLDEKKFLKMLLGSDGNDVDPMIQINTDVSEGNLRFHSKIPGRNNTFAEIFTDIFSQNDEQGGSFADAYSISESEVTIFKKLVSNEEMTEEEVASFSQLVEKIDIKLIDVFKKEYNEANEQLMMVGLIGSCGSNVMKNMMKEALSTRMVLMILCRVIQEELKDRMKQIV